MRINLTCHMHTEVPGLLHEFGGASPDGRILGVTSRYMTRNGRPWIPVMGEFHYSRYPREDWEESLGKMRAGGVGVVATYLFWIHHEEVEGQYCWEDNLDVAAFVGACQKRGLEVVLRIGPWAHGEARNGGYPDWLIQKPFPVRGNHPGYLDEVKRFYTAVANQLTGKGLMFHEGGPVVAIQLDNEYGHCGGLTGDEGRTHMMHLKRMAQQAGLLAPFYTATGWGGGVVVEGEMLPVLGGYADAPWADHTDSLPPSDMFVFSPIVPKTGIGMDLSLVRHESFSYDPEAWPYLTAELGGGLQVTHHRRPIVEAEDVEAMALVKLGCGANLLGYYMYHGGTNPTGQHSTMQESRASGYANDLPVLSYDFQAPLGEYGQARPSWHALRVLHSFLKDYGETLADMASVLPNENVTDPSDPDGLRCAVRRHGESGFLFINRHQRGNHMHDMEGIVLVLGGVDWPRASLRADRCHIWPFHMDLSGLHLICATAQPLCRLEGERETTHVLFAHEDTGAVLRFENGEEMIVAPGARAHRTFQVPEEGTAGVRTVSVLVLTRTDAEQALKVKLGKSEHLIIGEGILVQENDNQISLTTFSPDNLLFFHPPIVGLPTVDHAAITTCAPGDREGLRILFEPVVGRINLTGTRKRDRLTIPEMIRRTLWQTNTYPPEAPCPLVMDMDLVMEQGPGVHEWFLELEPEGDAARFMIDGQVRADWFYTGNPWEIGLRRFLRDQQGKASPLKIQVSLDPLCRTDAVYLEKFPVFHKGEACRMRAMRLRPQYRCLLTFDL